MRYPWPIRDQQLIVFVLLLCLNMDFLVTYRGWVGHILSAVSAVFLFLFFYKTNGLFGAVFVVSLVYIGRHYHKERKIH